MKFLAIGAAGVLVLSGVGVAAVAQVRSEEARPPIQTADTPQQSFLPIKDFMRHVINPAAEAYWAHSGVDDAAEGTKDKAPKDDASWSEQYDHAAALQEAGNLLLAEGRRINDPVWIKNANKLILGGQEGVKASIAKDENAGFDAGSTMYEACYDCHGKYVVRPKNSLYGRPQDLPKPDGDTKSLR